MHARYVREFISVAVFAVPITLCTRATRYPLDQAYAPAIAKHRGTLCVGCDICFFALLAMIVLFALTGAATAAFCGRHVSDSGEAGIA